MGWRDACRPYGSTDSELSGLFITENSVKSHEMLLEFATTNSKSNHLTLMDRRLFVHRYRSPDEAPDVEHDVFHEKFVPESVIAGIDGTDVLGLPFSQAKEMVRGAQNVKLLCKAAEIFFTNAAFAIELGLFGLFRFIIEDIGTDLSYNMYCGLRLVEQPLVVHALVKADPRYFYYLLSLDTIDPNPTLPGIGLIPDRSATLLHTTMGEHSPFLDLTFVAKDALEDVRRAKAIIQSEKVNVNTRNSYGFTPLDYLIYNPRAHIHTPRIVHNRTIYSYDIVDIYLTKAILDKGGIMATDDLGTILSFLPDRRGHRGIIAELR